MVGCRLTIHGRVQGVAYRATLAGEARRLGLRGWVRNRRDGAVEAVVCGGAEAVESLVAWAAGGPPLARVDSVERGALEPAAWNALAPGFEIRPTV